MEPNVKTFNQNSDKYQSDRPRYPKELYELLKNNCKSTDLVWDCGCGNGQVAIDLVNDFEYVEASDINQNQIDNGFKHDRIHYSVQNSEETRYLDKSFDAICAAQCLHWFDLGKYFNEVKRILKPDGVFACWGYSFFCIDMELDQIFKREIFDPIDHYWSDKNRILHNGYKSVKFPFERIECPAIEMNINWSLNELMKYLSTWSAVKLHDEHQCGSIVDKTSELISQKYDMDTKRLVKMDFFVYMGKRTVV